MPLLNNRYEIDDTRPLPDFDGPFARAFAAKGKGVESDLLALVCTHPLAARGDAATSMRSLNHPGLLKLKDAGNLDWPQNSSRAYAFVYDKPPGHLLAPKSGVPFPSIKEEPFVALLATPLFGALQAVSGAGIFHGAVRATNVYMGDADGGKAVLGDGLAAPAGSTQPAVYETAERMMADGALRGTGSPADDLYALGVTLLSALLGEEPLHGMAPDAILSLKLERGSYAALAGERRFPPALIEVLRGLLADDPTQRWNFEDFQMWTEGRRLTPKQSMAARKAARPFPVAGHNYLQPRQLAQALARESATVGPVVKGEDLPRWLAHGLHDEDMVKRLEDARGQAKRMRAGPEDERYVTAAVMVLDPTGPLRYRGIRVFPAGLGAAMAEAALRGDSLQPYAEMITNDLSGAWLALQPGKKPEMVGLIQQVERTKDLIEKAGLGFGPERALYEISPMQPCLSPVVKNYYAMNAPQFLQGLDKVGGIDAGSLIDRHSAAFLLARDRKILPQLMRAVESAQDAQRKGLALLTLFADLQYRHGPEKLRVIARAILPLADEVVRRFQNRPRQGKVREALRHAADEGDICGMLKAVDDPGILQLDSQEYESARILYRETEAEVMRLSTEGSDKKLLAEAAGQPLAAVLAVSLAFVLAVFVLLRTFFMS